MQREVATLPWDLPHEFQFDGRAMASRPPKLRCQCGRQKADELHTAVVVETASTRTTFITEKGI